MRKILLGILIVSCISCTRQLDDAEQLSPLPQEEKKECNPKDVCCFDLSDKPGEYDLFSKWEFVAFQKSKDSYFDNLTCLARIAEFALGGEDYENVFKVTLSVSKEFSSLASCEDLPSFEFRSFNHEILGCYEATNEGILKFNFTEENITFFPSHATTTLPMQEFENLIKKSLADVESYEIDQNKLYLKVEGKSEKMVFVAIEELEK